MSSSPSPPTSYSSLPFTQIRLSHVPASSTAVTPVIVLELYRPKNNNAFTGTMMEEFLAAYELFNVDDRVKCIVLTGHGRMFCAGADMDIGFKRSMMEDGGSREERHRDGGGRISLAIHNSPKPTIAALNGPAVGVGITMTLPATIRLASTTSKIGFVFARRGIVMEACSSFFLPRLIGYARALHLVTVGGVYGASDRLLDGLFSEVLPPERVLPRAIELAREIASQTSRVSTKVMRDMIWRAPGSAEETHLLDSRLLYAMFESRDNDEGVKSFLEKRAPKFEGTMDRDAPPAWPWWRPVDVGPPKESKDEKAKL